MDTTQNERKADDWDWPAEHRDYWTALGAQYGATIRQVRMAYALSTNMSQTRASMFAGYKGEARTRGYSAARTKVVTALLMAAEGDGWKIPSTLLTEEDKDELLGAMMTSGDPTVRLRALEQSDRRRRERKAEIAALDRPVTLQEALAALLEGAGPIGPLLAAAVYCNTAKTLTGFPMRDQILPHVKAKFPEAWRMLMNEFPPDTLHHKPDIERVAASGDVLSWQEILANASQGGPRTAKKKADGGNAERDTAQPVS